MPRAFKRQKTRTKRQKTRTQGPGLLAMPCDIQNVEMGGIEPPSDVVLSGLLRAQFASDFLGPSHVANSWLIRAQSSKSPVYPDDGGKQQWLSK